jgi:hypothetical protein
MFLRGRKFQMDRVTQSLEQLAIFQKSHPEWNVIDDMPTFLEQYKCGLSLSKFRDAEGRRVITVRVKRQEDLDLTQNEYFRILQVFLNACLYEQETQIAGVVFIFDLRAITFNLIKKYSFFSLLEFFSQLKYCPIRIKQINLIGLPLFAVIMFKFVRKLLSEKLQKRINLMKNLSDLHTVMDTTQLLINDDTEYNEESIMFIDEYVAKASQMYGSFDVDFAKMKKHKSMRTQDLD